MDSITVIQSNIYLSFELSTLNPRIISILIETLSTLNSPIGYGHHYGNPIQHLYILWVEHSQPPDYIHSHRNVEHSQPTPVRLCSVSIFQTVLPASFYTTFEPTVSFLHHSFMRLHSLLPWHCLVFSWGPVSCLSPFTATMFQHPDFHPLLSYLLPTLFLPTSTWDLVEGPPMTEFIFSSVYFCVNPNC